MLPEAATEDLLYVSNLQNVAVYSYPEGKRVGTLKGFYRPFGECVNSTGDVFIANQNTIVEYLSPYGAARDRYRISRQA
jgi:hypothetical protein